MGDWVIGKKFVANYQLLDLIVVRVGVCIAAAHLSFKTVLASFPAHGS